MKTVIDINTNETLFHTNDYTIELMENQDIVDFRPYKITERPQSEEVLNELQYTELKSTDWYIIRKVDTGEEIPQEIIDLRNEIRTRYVNLKR